MWLDQELHGGDTWWQTILKQIQDADVFVFALSNHSQRSKPCRAELDYARALGIPVLPVQIGPQEGLRSAPIADLQIVDYRQRNADAALGLIAAVQKATLRRGPLPEPLPDQPPIPFEYLMRLGRAIDAPQMHQSEQVGVLAQLRQGLEDEDDANARQDIVMLLQNMRRRPDATYRSVSEIDTLLATIDQAPPIQLDEPPGQPFPFHAVYPDLRQGSSPGPPKQASPHQQPQPRDSGRTGRDRPPKNLRASILLWIAAAILTVLQFTIMISTNPLTGSEITFVAAIWLVPSVMTAVLASFLWAGKEWIRTTVVMVGGTWGLLQFFPLVFGLAASSEPLAFRLLALGIIIVITRALVLMFLPAANLYFRSSSSARFPGAGSP